MQRVEPFLQRLLFEPCALRLRQRAKKRVQQPVGAFEQQRTAPPRRDIGEEGEDLDSFRRPVEPRGGAAVPMPARANSIARSIAVAIAWLSRSPLAVRLANIVCRPQEEGTEPGR